MKMEIETLMGLREKEYKRLAKKYTKAELVAIVSQSSRVSSRLLKTESKETLITCILDEKMPVKR